MGVSPMRTTGAWPVFFRLLSFLGEAETEETPTAKMAVVHTGETPVLQQKRLPCTFSEALSPQDVFPLPAPYSISPRRVRSSRRRFGVVNRIASIPTSRAPPTLAGLSSTKTHCRAAEPRSSSTAW